MCVLSHFDRVLLSMGFSRKEYWSGLSCPPPGDLPDPRIELASYSVSFISRQVLYHQSHLGSLVFSHVTLAKHLTPGTPGPHLRGEMKSSETLIMRNDKHFKTGWANFFGLIASLQRSIEFCWLGIWANRSLEKMKKKIPKSHSKKTTGFWLLVLALYPIVISSDL